MRHKNKCRGLGRKALSICMYSIMKEKGFY